MTVKRSTCSVNRILAPLAFLYSIRQSNYKLVLQVRRTENRRNLKNRAVERCWYIHTVRGVCMCDLGVNRKQAHSLDVAALRRHTTRRGDIH